MAIYAISWEGVQALRTLSAQLQASKDEILDSTFMLERQLDLQSGELGAFEQEISNVIQQNRHSLIKNHKAIIELSRKISSKADEIESLLLSDLSMETETSAVPVPVPAPPLRLVPNRVEPRDLAVTRHRCTPDGEGHYVYDSPLEMDRYLYHNQGSADASFLGTCGLCACVNILRLAGVLISELEVLMYARSSESGGQPKPILCSRSYDAAPGMNGGTSPLDRQMILRNFGIDSEVINMQSDSEGKIADSNLELISRYVESGRGVILSVRATLLYGVQPKANDNHAVTVTSTVRDNNGSLLGFYIVDQKGTQYYSADRVKGSLTGREMNVTRQVIR